MFTKTVLNFLFSNTMFYYCSTVKLVRLVGQKSDGNRHEALDRANFVRNEIRSKQFGHTFSYGKPKSDPRDTGLGVSFRPCRVFGPRETNKPVGPGQVRLGAGREYVRNKRSPTCRRRPSIVVGNFSESCQCHSNYRYRHYCFVVQDTSVTCQNHHDLHNVRTLCHQ